MNETSDACSCNNLFKKRNVYDCLYPKLKQNRLGVRCTQLTRMEKISWDKQNAKGFVSTAARTPHPTLLTGSALRGSYRVASHPRYNIFLTIRY